MTAKMLQSDLWATITKLSRRSKRRHVAVAYLGRNATGLLPLSNGDTLVIDMSTASVKGGQTNPYEVEKYLKRGVAVYSCSNLHAKVFVFDRSAIIASSNVSVHSRDNLVEAGLLCKDRHIVASARGFVKSLQVEPVTPAYIESCKGIYRPPRSPNRGVRTGANAQAHSRLWILNVRPLTFSAEDERFCETGERRAYRKITNTEKYQIRSIKIWGKSRFRDSVSEGDLVVQLWRDGDRIEKVLPPSRVDGVTRKRTERTDVVFVHLEVAKRRHTLAWRKFKNAVAKAGLLGLGPNSAREVRPETVVHAILGLWA